jgi:hypothetical protein
MDPESSPVAEKISTEASEKFVRNNGLQRPYNAAQLMMSVYLIFSPILVAFTAQLYIIVIMSILYVAWVCGTVKLMSDDPGEIKHSKGDGDLFCNVCQIEVYQHLMNVMPMRCIVNSVTR